MKSTYIRTFALIVLVFAAIQPSSAQTPGYSYDRDICYRADDDYSCRMCRLDVAYKEGGKDMPVIVWFHGGGLTGGHKDLPEALCRNGYVVIGAGYRLSPEVPVEKIIDDAAGAVAWAYDNAERYGGSRSKIYIAGHSAGGYLVDMLGLEKKWLGKYGIDADSLAAIVPYSGQVITHFASRKLEGIDALDPRIDELAPLYHMRPDCPPMLVISADREKELYGRYEETAYFVRMMKLKGHKDMTFLELDGFDHGNMATPGHFLLVNYIKEREK
ncbi:MAG: alpha/beta hydrolase fold domain-containing protein [Bacteroidales bacterium]|nr:alpha/beta hydrolase fold domain-containing protein [Bacteroidales bacterium]